MMNLPRAVTAGLIASAFGIAIGLLDATAIILAQATTPHSGVDKLTEFGVAGILISVIVYIVYLLLNKTLASRDIDLAWHREELARKSAVFQEALDIQTKASQVAIQYMVDKFSTNLEKIESRLVIRTEDIVKILETMRSVVDLLEDVRVVIHGCSEIQHLRVIDRKKSEGTTGAEPRKE